MQTDEKGGDPTAWQKIEIVRPGGRAGMSLIEVLVVISFLAIVAALAIPSISNVLFSSSYQTAQRNMNLLNGAVIAYSQSSWGEINTNVFATSSGSDDEAGVFNCLRYRNTNAALAAPGSPYLPPNATFVATSETNTYRARWNGRMFEILPVGTSGTGLDLMKVMGAIQAPPSNDPDPRSTNS